MSAYEVIACIMVAATTVTTMGNKRLVCLLLMTSSTKYFVEAGRISPDDAIDDHQQEAYRDNSPPRLQQRQNIGQHFPIELLRNLASSVRRLLGSHRV